MNYENSNILAEHLTEFMVEEILSEAPKIKKVIGIYPVDSNQQCASLQNIQMVRW